MQNLFDKIGVHIPEILLPAEGTDLTKWSVIACDQYTSQPGYWQKVNEEVNGSPSTLRLTFPEIYLKDNDKDIRIKNINATMAKYLEEGVLKPQRPGFILVDRSTPNTSSRKGLIMAVDLECYDYRAGSTTLIRATEGTVLDRIPPRVKIRENAPIELPHIMLLIDDPDKTVIEALSAKTEKYEKLYDFELMMGGGHIKGWKVDDEESLEMLAASLYMLAFGKLPGNEYQGKNVQSEGGKNDSGQGKYGQSDNRPGNGEQSDSCHNMLLFAAGDGNHSLATAKAHWENVKARLLQQTSEGKTTVSDDKSAEKLPISYDTPAEKLQLSENSLQDDHTISCRAVPVHPARFALVEVVNVHDEGLVFEPIHRVLFGVDGTSVLNDILKLESCNSNITCKLFNNKAELDAELEAITTEEAKSAKSSSGSETPSHLLPFILEGQYGLLTVKNPKCNLEVGSLQAILDELIKTKNTKPVSECKRSENSCNNDLTNSSLEIDYIHGDEVVTELGSKKNCMGFYLPVMDKRDLFKTVILDGVLPRKTFSMGEAQEKRYYLECRRIR